MTVGSDRRRSRSRPPGSPHTGTQVADAARTHRRRAGCPFKVDRQQAVRLAAALLNLAVAEPE
jgi:hypothetical protein